MAVLEAEPTVQTKSASGTNVLTYERYLQEFLTEPVTMQPCEIIDGVRVYMTSPNWWHQKIAFALAKLLDQYQSTGIRGLVLLSPLDVMIKASPLRVRQPDVLFITNQKIAHAGGMPDLGPLTAAPELVIEILSPSETRRILNAKIADFCVIGVRECWVISPNGETAEVLRLTPDGPIREAFYGSGQTLQSLTFPELTLAVDDIFRIEE